MHIPINSLFCWCYIVLILLLFLRSLARPLNPNLVVEGRKKQSLSSSTFAALLKDQYVHKNGEIPGGPPVLCSPHQIGNHEMSAGPKVRGGEYGPLNKGRVPPSAPNPTTLDAIGNP